MLQTVKPSIATTLNRECPACGDERSHRVVYSKLGYPILRCETCGLGRTEVNDFKPEEFYTDDYFQGGRADGYGDYKASAPTLRAEFQRLIDRLAPNKGKLLEVGCAYGYFLEVARKHYEVLGLEVCQDAARSCQERGLPVIATTVNNDILSKFGPFDMVVMLDVIEHVPDPNQVIGDLAQAMKPGARLVITTGDWKSPLARLMGKRWRLMTPPQHLFFFAPDNLQMLLARHGLEVIQSAHPGKHVPLGLALYQVASRMNLPVPRWNWLHTVGVPVNLGDAFRLIARKRT